MTNTSRAVSMAGLDLSSDAGVAMLDRRVTQAIKQVCKLGDARDVAAKAQSRKCAKQARATSDNEVKLAVARAKSERYAGQPAKVASNDSVIVASR